MPEAIVSEREHARGAVAADQAVLRVVRVGRGAAAIGLGIQVAVGVIGKGCIANPRVLIERVGDVVCGCTLVGHRDAVPLGIIGVLDLTAVWGSYAGQLAVDVVRVSPHPGQGGHGDHAALQVIGVNELGVNRAIGRVVEFRLQLARGRVRVDGVGAVAMIQPGHAASVVIRVGAQQRTRAIQHLRQPANGIVLILNLVAGLIGPARPAARGVIGERQRLTAWINDLRQLEPGVVRVGGGTRGIGRCQQVATRIIDV